MRCASAPDELGSNDSGSGAGLSSDGPAPDERHGRVMVMPDWVVPAVVWNTVGYRTRVPLTE
jgi:hypothetical protein